MEAGTYGNLVLSLRNQDQAHKSLYLTSLTEREPYFRVLVRKLYVD
jgi:hypothetical protein